MTTGLGFFTEGHVLFSVGDHHSLFQVAWPRCWKAYKQCNETWIQATSYFEIVGIMIGQILIGFIGDWVGRRWGII